MKNRLILLLMSFFLSLSVATAKPQPTMNRPLEQVRSTILDKGYKFFEKGDYNLNFVAVRENDVFENTFSDSLYLPHKVNGVWQMPAIPITTLAGTLGFGGEKSPLTAAQTGTGVSGTAIILENQYPKGFKYINNGWRYPFVEYLQQNTAFDYLRDNNKDGLVSRNATKQSGNFSTHGHAMSAPGVNSLMVNYVNAAWSQGCIGSNAVWFFNKLMPIIRQSVKLHGQEITFTLLHAKDFV